MGQDTVGSKACSGCHAQIYRKYSAASMSRSSGKVGAGAFRENFDLAKFSDPALGADYLVSVAPEGYSLEFSDRNSAHHIFSALLGNRSHGDAITRDPTLAIDRTDTVTIALR